MNAKRRDQIRKAIEVLSQARIELEVIRDAEQEAYDALPESFQGSERGEKMEEAIGALENACSSLDDMESELGDVADGAS
jgi:hypothetical protein